MKPVGAWSLVIAQFVLIAVLVVWPAGSLWPRGPVTIIIAGALILAGAIVGVVAGTTLGSNLTPSPIPRQGGSLETSGIYGLVRHPIYSALLLVGLGLVVSGGSTGHLVAFVMLAMLLGFKARAEERMLVARDAFYRDYASRVGRFVPGIGRITQDGRGEEGGQTPTE